MTCHPPPGAPASWGVTRSTSPKPVAVNNIAIAAMAPSASASLSASGALDATSEMIATDAQPEREAIALYTEIIKTATAASDTKTATLFERILAEEQGHLETFMAMQAL